jgi:serine protease DegS
LEDDPFFRRFFDDDYPLIPRERLETSLGSGVVVSDQGYILTNHHVIQGAEEIQVALKDGRNAPAMIIGTDPESDIAVLKVAIEDLPAITLGQSDSIQVGDVVLAIGNPFGVGQTVTMGIISATGRDRLGLSTFENFIQTDAAINPGNSGGALVNAFGHIIGINTAIFTRSGGSQGIGFAIPINYAKDVTEQIIKHGHVIRGWLGIEIQGITPALAESFGLSDTKGVIVAGVLRDGPADKAGLKPGDIISKINNEAIRDGKQALNAIAKAKPGTNIELDILRQGKTLSMEATTAQRPLPKFN